MTIKFERLVKISGGVGLGGVKGTGRRGGGGEETFTLNQAIGSKS